MSWAGPRRGALFVVVLALAAGCGSSPPPPISVSLSPSSTKTIDQGQTVSVSATVANDRSSDGVSWTLNGPGSLSGSTPSSVTYTAPSANITTAQQATITATSVADKTKTASLQVTVNPLPQIPNQTLPNGTAGSPYSQTIAITGGTAPFQWSIYDGPILTGYAVGGSIPDGLTLDLSSGTISGMPASGGTWSFEATVTDATGASAGNSFLSIQINPAVAPGNPVPFLNQPLSPTAVSPGNAGFTLNVSGTGFVSGATVDLNGAPLATTFVSAAQLSAAVTAADVATPGTAVITVVNPAPGGGRSNPVYLQIGAPQTTVSFVNAPNSPLAISEPSAIVAADFNEDGKPDLAITANVRVYVLLGAGNGTFTPTSASPIPVPSPPYDDFGSPYVGPALAAGDFNNSGHQGLAVGLFQNLAAAIFFGNGDGTFTVADTLAPLSGQPTMALTAADFNADGNLDLAVASTLNGVSPTILLGYGRGAFNAVSQNIDVSALSSAAGDLNGDGKLDLVLGGSGIAPNGAGSILLGQGDGTFIDASTLNTNGFTIVADFNGDGKLDLAVCNSALNTITIFLGNGDGTFTTATGSPIAVGNQPEALLAGDFNNDGKLDLAIANFGDGTVTLLLGNGDGTFTPASGSPYAVGRGPLALAAADFNGDGKLDLAIINSTDGTVSILLQQ
jgi:FG-GAP-like repeat/Putative Ig domain/FG-GAP repeat